MEIKEEERVVISKPIASRPSCSNFGSFSELLAGVIGASPNNLCCETSAFAIRPKTVRFNKPPMVNSAPAKVISSQAEISGKENGNASDKVLKSDKCSVVYKPFAKLVSGATVSLLANMEKVNVHNHQPSASTEPHVQQYNHSNHNFRSQLNSNLHQETSKSTDPSKMESQPVEEDPISLWPTAHCDRPSYDGYNWRKYGQKQVKGSEYPRSYYKCTHPNCPVKKKVERSLDGQITEIVYRGEHNHSKPQPPKRNSSGTQALGNASHGTGDDVNNQLWSNQMNERDEGSEGRLENQNEMGLLGNFFQGKAEQANDHVLTGAVDTSDRNPDTSCGPVGGCEEGRKRLEVEEDEPRSKRRKADQSAEVGISGEGVQKPLIVMQNSIDSEILDDGFRWRKYGQKVVKGNPYPRSYYRCTIPNCNVRKHVERTLDDPRAFVTTYEGKHNHDIPLRSTNPATSETDLQANTSKDDP